MRSLRTSLIAGVVALGVFAGSANAAPVAESALDVASCGVDEFDGTALDSTRWNVLRPNAAGLSVAGGQLRLQALTGDLFGDRDTAQNVVLQNTPTGAWTATAQFDTSALTAEGQQTGIVVRKSTGRSATTFSKFVFINKGGGQPPLRAHLHPQPAGAARETPTSRPRSRPASRPWSRCA